MVFSTSAIRTTTQAKGAACTTLLTARQDEGRRPTNFRANFAKLDTKSEQKAVFVFSIDKRATLPGQSNSTTGAFTSSEINVSGVRGSLRMDSFSQQQQSIGAA
jgi:hypothetical protein